MPRLNALLKRLIILLGVLLVFALQIAAPVLADDASDVLALVNAQRLIAGVPALTLCARLTTAAVNQSNDMVARQFFSHTNPDGLTPGDRITTTGYIWNSYGENIAVGYPTAAAVVDGWMHSPGHKANILSPNYTDMGLGAAVGLFEDFPNSKYWTQTFGAGGSCNAPMVDLAVSLNDTPDPIPVTHNLTYSIVVTNNGPSTATSVTVKQTLPAGAAFVSHTPTQGTCSHTSTTVNCTLGNIAISGSATVTVIVTPPTIGTLTSVVSASDPPENNTNANYSRASASTIVQPPPPGAPTLIAPMGAITGVQPAFSWTAPTGAVRYEIQIGTSNPPTTARIISVATNHYTPPAPLVAGAYFWWVRAFNAAGVPSDSFSLVGSFTLNSPDGIAPLVNYFASQPIILTWNAVNGATAYAIEIADNPGMTSPFVTGSTSNLFYSTSTLSTGTYYWRVRDNNGGTWSSTQIFEVK